MIKDANWTLSQQSEIGRSYLRMPDAKGRAFMVRAFGAAVVHQGLRMVRASIETRTLDYQSYVGASDTCEPCTCRTCVVYGGDCAAHLGAEDARATLFRWRRRSSASRAVAPQLRVLGGF